MRVELALFDGDTLLERGEVRIGPTEQTSSFRLYEARYKLGAEAADIVLDRFADSVDLKTATLSMPIHQSNDWESIELGKYTLAFWCRLDA